MASEYLDRSVQTHVHRDERIYCACDMHCALHCLEAPCMCVGGTMHGVQKPRSWAADWIKPAFASMLG